MLQVTWHFNPLQWFNSTLKFVNDISSGIGWYLKKQFYSFGPRWANHLFEVTLSFFPVKLKFVFKNIICGIGIDGGSGGGHALNMKSCWQFQEKMEGGWNVLKSGHPDT